MFFPRVCLSASSKYGKRNWYLLVSVMRVGRTLVLDRITESANSSPNTALMINLGIEKIVGGFIHRQAEHPFRVGGRVGQ